MSQIFRLLNAVLKKLPLPQRSSCSRLYSKRLLGVTFISSQAGAAIKSISSFPEPLEGVCGCTCSNCPCTMLNLLFQIKLYWIEFTLLLLLTSHFSSAVSILQDPYLYFEISPVAEKRWRDERVSRNCATNVSTLFLTSKHVK